MAKLRYIKFNKAAREKLTLAEIQKQYNDKLDEKNQKELARLIENTELKGKTVAQMVWQKFSYALADALEKVMPDAPQEKAA